MLFFFSIRRRHTSCALVTGVQTCALPISAPRRGIVISYCLGWLKPFELQWLVYPPQVARLFSPELAALVGYAQHRPNLGNVEGQCPSILLGDHVPDYLPAVDALRPDQADAAAMFVRRSEERRVGKEWVSTCRSRWSPDH